MDRIDGRSVVLTSLRSPGEGAAGLSVGAGPGVDGAAACWSVPVVISFRGEQKKINKTRMIKAAPPPKIKIRFGGAAFPFKAVGAAFPPVGGDFGTFLGFFFDSWRCSWIAIIDELAIS
jgi:hypothetical protein